MTCGGTFDIETRRGEIVSGEQRMSEPGFWDRPDEARRIVAALKQARKAVADWGARDESLTHIGGLLELAEGEGDEGMLGELSTELAAVETQIADLTRLSLLSGEQDSLGAMITIHPGAGG